MYLFRATYSQHLNPKQSRICMIRWKPVSHSNFEKNKEHTLILYRLNFAALK